MLDKEREELKTQTPDVDKIKCRTCQNKLESLVVQGMTVERYTYAHCLAFPAPVVKPYGVLWDGADCPKYRPES